MIVGPNPTGPVQCELMVIRFLSDFIRVSEETHTIHGWDENEPRIAFIRIVYSNIRNAKGVRSFGDFSSFNELPFCVMSEVQEEGDYRKDRSQMHRFDRIYRNGKWMGNHSAGNDA